MRRADLIKTIEGIGCVLVRHGGKHDWYRNPITGISQPVPRHREINEGLARHVVKMLSNSAHGDSDSQSTAKDSA
jgi:predicted RNA binding protein YcfA (HicA-like mRNA interferase family)